MEGADLARARMEGAVLKSVDLTEVPINADQLNSMFGDASVRLPEGIAKPDHWPDWDLPTGGDHDFSKEWRKWQADPAGYKPPPKPED